MALRLRNQEEFSLEVEKLVNDKQMLYMEAVLEHATKCDLDIEGKKLKNLLSENILQRLKSEANTLNMFRNRK